MAEMEREREREITKFCVYNKKILGRTKLKEKRPKIIIITECDSY